MVDVYGSVASFRSYWTDRGVALSSHHDDAVTVSLIAASEHLDMTYRALFPGYKKGLRAQVREWPRYDAFDIDRNSIPDTETPVEVQYAVYELAYKHLHDPTALVKDYTPNQYQSVSVDGAIKVTYNDTSPESIQLVFVKVNRILAPVLTGKGSFNTGIATQKERW